MRENQRMGRIINYLRKNLSKGYTLDSLKWALVNQGYSRIEVQRAIDELNRQLAKKAPELKEKPIIKYEVFDEYDNPIKIKKQSFFKRFFKEFFR